MSIQLTQSKQSVPWEKNDCTVRAYCEAFEISYIEAYGLMLGAGRKARKGFNFIAFMQDMHSEIKAFPRPNMTVESFIQTIAIAGNWIILIRGHVFAVKDKTIIDTWPAGNLNRHVLGAWRVK